MGPNTFRVLRASPPCRLAREAWGGPWPNISARGPKAPEACLHAFRFSLPEDLHVYESNGPTRVRIYIYIYK